MDTQTKAEELILGADDAEDASAESSDAESEYSEQGRSEMIRQRRLESDESDSDVESDHSPVDAEEALDSDNDIGSDPADDAGEAGTGKGKQLLSEKEVRQAQKRERKSGVVYMSRVPPYMKPIKVRHMLEKYAQIGRIYLIEESEKRRTRRVKGGGNRRRQFEEGWIEFKNKKYAKAVASMLNNTKMGGKKHGFYHDDLWNLKYLPKFKWRHLVEQLASEKAAREQRLQTETNQARRELDAYMKNVDRAKKMSSIRAKRQRKVELGEEVKPLDDRSRSVRQRDVVVREATEDQSSSSGKRRRTQDTQVASILDKIM
ncbi:RNA-binding ATPase activator esf2 [Coemansia guatemalensis]|uniref:18S rRNA factor 2 n=1 Tax=Coemansia guatemalensis TaxID=2761395 RepID=A0A9W8I4V6_9FUNG|nr:RNA-binding ATPase activator esf2 [Coemansia guatemalensis]